MALGIATLGFGVVGLTQSASAKVTYQRLSSAPKVIRGTWYSTSKGKTVKLKISAKKMSPVYKYRKYRFKEGMVDAGPQYFTPFKVKGVKANEFRILNNAGIQTIRKTTIKHKSVLIVYNEQYRFNEYIVYTKAKHNSAQKVVATGNPYGRSINDRKSLKAQKKAFDKMNPGIKKYLGKALKKKTIKGSDIYKGINLTYYTAGNPYLKK
mgnify:FL=1